MFTYVEEKDKKVVGFDSKSTTTSPDDKTIKPKKQLGVVITGCDSGLGKELAIQLLEAKQGFVVFCGCLLEDSFEQFKQYEGAMPVKMDVTSDTDVQAAASVVSDWLLQKQPDGEERHLLALVNNAGIGIPGLVDWLEISDFRKVMDVNYFGVIRCVKAFQPIFKGQAAAVDTNNEKVLKEEDDKDDKAEKYNFYPDGRIINVISVAGVFSPGQYGVAYGSSKFALDALTNNLRQEMSMFGVKVIGIHPGLHNTPMGTTNLVQGQNMVNKLPQTKRQDEYGEQFIETFLKLMKMPAGFDCSICVNSMMDAVVLKDPPIQKFVGMDAKYIFHFFSKLPTWLSFGIFDKLIAAGFESEEEYMPKMMLDKKKAEIFLGKQEEGTDGSDKKDQ